MALYWFLFVAHYLVVLVLFHFFTFGLSSKCCIVLENAEVKYQEICKMEVFDVQHNFKYVTVQLSSPTVTYILKNLKKHWK